MMKIILSLFSIYQLSLGNRLLLQGGAPAFPPPLPVMPPPATPQTTAAALPPVIPLNPAPQPLPPQQAVPITPQGPAPGAPATPGVPGTPQQAPPAQAPAQPLFPWQQFPGSNPYGMGNYNTLQCSISPPAPSSCAGQTKTVMNPMDGFEVFCGGMPGSCYQSTINIGYMMNGPFAETISFSAASDYALAGGKINFANYRGDQISIDQVLCERMYSCAGLTITLGQDMRLEQGAFFCGQHGSCQGCIIKQGPYDFGEPCSNYAEPI